MLPLKCPSARNKWTHGGMDAITLCSIPLLFAVESEMRLPWRSYWARKMIRTVRISLLYSPSFPSG